MVLTPSTRRRKCGAGISIMRATRGGQAFGSQARIIDEDRAETLAPSSPSTSTLARSGWSRVAGEDSGKTSPFTNPW